MVVFCSKNLKYLLSSPLKGFGSLIYFVLIYVMLQGMSSVASGQVDALALINFSGKLFTFHS